MTAKNGEEIKQCYYRLYDYLRQEAYSPEDMKECLIRFNMALLNAYKIHQEIQSEVGGAALYADDLHGRRLEPGPDSYRKIPADVKL